MADPPQPEAPQIHVSLTHSSLSIEETTAHVRSPKAGALVIFAGTTRDSFSGKAVLQLQYSAYEVLALKTMRSIAENAVAKFGLLGVAIVHRLGIVPIGEESVVIAVSAPHRKDAWLAGEEVLEEVKARVEIWKLEEFAGEEGVWRANRDGAAGVRVV